MTMNMTVVKMWRLATLLTMNMTVVKMWRMVELMMMNMTGDNVEDGRTDDDEYDCGVNAEGLGSG